jgi:hypothetical protein
MATTTRILIISADGTTEDRQVTFAATPNYDSLRKAMEGVFDEGFEHVNVLLDDRRRDMFVGETSAINGRHSRNEKATTIYRNNALTRSPGIDPETIPAIYGPAVLFPDVVVWN